MTLNLKEWNPTLYPVDRTHIMPIITPAYPVMCSTHNVSDSTLAVMMQEFLRGKLVHEKIMAGKASWDELFEESDFFTKYKWYLEVTTSTGSEETMHLWYVWRRLLRVCVHERFQGRHSRVKAADVGQGSQGQYSTDQDRTSLH
jgi:poly(A) polymerase Pap1